MVLWYFPQATLFSFSQFGMLRQQIAGVGGMLVGMAMVEVVWWADKIIREK
jgi:hypothetical protein